MQHVTPLLMTWALLAVAPGSAPNPLPHPTPRHPHHPRAIKIGGVKGDITVTYITLTYNPERLKDLKPGFAWHLGFAQLKTDVPLKVGDTQVPAGRYKLNAYLKGDGKTWSLGLENGELTQAKWQVMRAQRGGNEEAVAKARDAVKAIEAKLKKAGTPATIPLPTSTFKADDEEHLTLYAVNHGWATPRMGSTDNRGKAGVRASLRASFGDLHYKFDVEEVIEGAQEPADEQPSPPYRRR